MNIKGKGKGSLFVYVDGASRGNPGPAGAAAIAIDGHERPLREVSQFLGRATNNEAEYRALLLGLRLAQELGARKVTLYTDSELLARQVDGSYRVRSASLRGLYEEALTLMRCFEKAAVVHIPRERNLVADGVANRAIDNSHEGRMPE